MFIYSFIHYYSSSRFCTSPLQSALFLLSFSPSFPCSLVAGVAVFFVFFVDVFDVVAVVIFFVVAAVVDFLLLLFLLMHLL